MQQRKVRIGAAVVVAAFAVFALVGILVSSDYELDARHAPFTFDERFDFANGSFDAYLAWSERRIRAARAADSDEAVIANLLPFRLEPAPTCPVSVTRRYRSGVVLTHDVLESPYTMREIGAYFQSRCFVVFGIALPGHGTRAGELLQADWQEWATAEAFAARELGREVEYLYLAGHGVGGTLAVLEAARNPAVTGLVLFAPRLDTRLQSWQAAVAGVFGWLVPGTRWAAVVPAYTEYRYDSRPWRLDGQVNALVRAMQDALPLRALEVPVFLVATVGDADADTQAMLDYMADRVHPGSHTLLYSSRLTDTERQMTVQVSASPTEGLLGLSHLGLMIPLYDREFGWGGVARNCGHYYPDQPDLYERCRAGEREVTGELSPENLNAGLLERIQFNPYYLQMTYLLDSFLGGAAVSPGILEV